MKVILSKENREPVDLRRTAVERLKDFGEGTLKF